jgi:hypothetical protein
MVLEIQLSRILFLLLERGVQDRTEMRSHIADRYEIGEREEY